MIRIVKMALGIGLSTILAAGFGFLVISYLWDRVSFAQVRWMSHSLESIMTLLVWGLLAWLVAVLLVWGKRAHERTIVVPPGSRLRAFAEFVFKLKTFQEIFEPICRDLFDEACAALRSGNVWKFRWVCLRGWWSFWAAFIAQMPVSVAKKVYQIWKAIS